MRTTGRIAAAAAVTASLAVLLAGPPGARSDGSPGATFVSGPAMQQDRIFPAVANLPGGRVGVFGGHGGGGFNAHSTAEVWTEAGGWHTLAMNTPHDTGALARLADGRFLLAGGSSDLGVPAYATAEVYDPSDDSFTPTSAMSSARAGCSAATLASGKVLVAGAWYDATTAGYGEVWDPATGEWTTTGSLASARAYPWVVPCADGKAIVFSGVAPYGGSADLTAELYDPDTNAFTPLDSGVLMAHLTVPEIFVQSIDIGDRRTASGKYLFLGGASAGGAELFTVDPVTKTFDALPVDGVLSGEVAWYGPVVDRTGLVAYLPVIDAYHTRGFGWNAVDLVTGELHLVQTYVALPNLQELSYAAQTVLPDGRLFVAGGYRSDRQDNFLGSTALLLATPDVQPQATVPATPADLSVLPDGGTLALVAWTHDPPFADGYRVERRTLPSGSWSEIAAPGAGARDLADDGVVRGAAYEYRVCAFNSVGQSDWTASVGVTMPGGRCTAARTLQFGAIRARTERVRNVVVRNTSAKQALLVRVADVTGSFAASATPQAGTSWTSIPKKGRTKIQVVFHPGDRGTHRGVLTLDTSDAKHETLTVKLLGRALKPRVE